MGDLEFAVILSKEVGGTPSPAAAAAALSGPMKTKKTRFRAQSWETKKIKKTKKKKDKSQILANPAGSVRRATIRRAGNETDYVERRRSVQRKKTKPPLAGRSRS